MTQITGISAQNFQSFQFKLPDGTTAYFKLTYAPRVSYWFMDVTWGSEIIKGVKLSNVPNVLEQYTNVLPFGVNIWMIDYTEPILINDFLTGRAIFNILSDSEIALISEKYMGT